jgi:hypothetical protein
VLCDEVGQIVGHEGNPDAAIQFTGVTGNFTTADQVFPNGATLVVNGNVIVPHGVPMKIGSFKILVPDSFPIGAKRPQLKQLTGEQSKFASRTPEF